MTHGNRGSRWWLAALLLLTVLPRHATAAEPIRVALFGFQLIDTSLQGSVEGLQPAEQRRLAQLDERLRQAFAASDQYALVGPADDESGDARKWRDCPQCVGKIARSLGADVAVTGTVQKVSNLILNMNLREWDAATGELRRGMSVDLRGNTDESWSRGLSNLLRRYFDGARTGE